jgi:hypothetical protein
MVHPLPRALAVLAVPLLLAAAPRPGYGQDVERPAVDAETLAARRTAVNTFLSLALPGTGQLRDGKARGWAYLAAEAAGWGVWLQRRHRGAQLRDRYRDLAWERGRIQSGPRMDGDFPYYEALSKWERSGAFDAAATPGIQPETDPDTFNGAIWALAAGIYLPGGTGTDSGTPGYDDALRYYETRAYGEAFLWDWSDAPEAQAELKHLIHDSDDRFQEATVVVGLVLANHLVSAVDAYLSTSFKSHEPQLQLHPSFVGGRRGWTLSLNIGALP